MLALLPMRPTGGLLTLVLVWCFACGTSWAQSSKPPEVERVQFTTKDGVELVGDYYAVRTGQKAPVAVLLADEGESRLVFRNLAERLQDPEEGEPCAVLAIDLRGQGDSVTQRAPNGSTSDLAGDKPSRKTVTMMVNVDMEAVRQFLVGKNDAGALNLNRMTYIGIGMGAVVAVNAAALDWSAPMLSASKQGKDVKSVVLISPPWKYKGAGLMNALRQRGVQNEVAVLLMYGGEDRTSTSSAEKIYKQLEKARGEQPPVTDDALPSLLKAPGRSALTGSKWLKQAGDNAEKLIVRFTQEHVAEPDFAWSKRRIN